MSKAMVTTDHDEIRKWVEARGGFPARVKGTGGRKGSDAGLLRIDYPGFSGTESLEKISWDAWFTTFDDEDLAFLAQDTIGGRGKTSRFSKLVARTTAMATTRGARAGSGRNGAKKKSAAGRAKATSKRTAARRPRTKTSAKRASTRRLPTEVGMTTKRTAKRTSARRTGTKRPAEETVTATRAARRGGTSTGRRRRTARGSAAKTSSRATTKRAARNASA